MKNIKFIIPNQTRTIFLHDSYKNTTYKYKINFPKIQVFGRYNGKRYSDKVEIEKYEWYAYALNDKDELCHLPLPNVGTDNTICFGHDDYGNQICPKNKSEFKEYFFYTKFSNSLTRSCSFDFDRNLVIGIEIDDLKNYFENWEKKQKVKLKKLTSAEVDYTNILWRSLETINV